MSANVIFTYYLRIVVLKKFFKKDFGNLFFAKIEFFFYLLKTYLLEIISRNFYWSEISSTISSELINSAVLFVNPLGLGKFVLIKIE